MSWHVEARRLREAWIEDAPDEDGLADLERIREEWLGACVAEDDDAARELAEEFYDRHREVFPNDPDE